MNSTPSQLSFQLDELKLDPTDRSALTIFLEIARNSIASEHADGTPVEKNPNYGPARLLIMGAADASPLALAEALATQLGVELYKVQLGEVVSKFIAQTEKNLESIFDVAQSENWILFFDEADALFGQRTEHFTHQEVGYILQHLERFGGPAILVTRNVIEPPADILGRFQAVVRLSKV